MTPTSGIWVFRGVTLVTGSGGFCDCVCDCSHVQSRADWPSEAGSASECRGASRGRPSAVPNAHLAWEQRPGQEPASPIYFSDRWVLLLSGSDHRFPPRSCSSHRWPAGFVWIFSHPVAQSTGSKIVSFDGKSPFYSSDCLISDQTTER